MCNPLNNAFTNSYFRMKSSIYHYTTHNWRGNYVNDDSWHLYLSKRIILLFGAMVRKRHMDVTFPVNMTFTYSFSDVCGHASFLFLSLSYLGWYHLRLSNLTTNHKITSYFY